MADRSGYIGRAPSDSSVTVARQTNQPTTTTSTFVFNSGYDVGYLDVYINGSKLINALDYTATDTQNVTLTTAAVSGDVVEFVAYKAFNLSNVVSSTPGDFTVDGTVTATSFVGSGANLTGITAGATLSAGSGAQRLVVTSLTSGTMTSAATDAELTYNSGTNTLSATTFSGALTGNASGTAGGLTGTPNIVVGSVTGTTGSFSGNVSIGGTLTYEDVTNVDSVGLITARSGIIVTGVVTATEFDGQTELRSWLFG